MNIAYVYNSYATRGGLERILIEKANALSQRPDVNVHLIALEDVPGSASAYCIEPKVTLHELGLTFNIDIDLKKNPFAFVCKWLKRSHKAYIAIKRLVRNHHIDILINFPENMHHPLTASGCLNIYESHCSRLNTSYHYANPWMRRPIRNFNLRKSKLIVSLTKNDAKNWPEFKRVEIIPNFSNIKPCKPYDPDIRRVIAVGRLMGQKGFDILIKAWESVARSHPDWKLDIYGTGRDKEMLQDMIEKSGLVDKVTLCGLSDDMPMVYASGSIFVLSSRYEGFGLVVLEAMTCGVPCVSFDCPEGPSEIITDGRDGILVPFRKLSDSQRAEALAENICRMIGDRDMRIRMSQEAIAKAATFSRDAIIDRWIELFKKITEK